MIGKLGSSAGFAIIYIFSAELFPTTVRNAGIGASSASARVGGMLAPQVAALVCIVELYILAEILLSHRCPVTFLKYQVSIFTSLWVFLSFHPLFLSNFSGSSIEHAYIHVVPSDVESKYLSIISETLFNTFRVYSNGKCTIIWLFPSLYFQRCEI